MINSILGIDLSNNRQLEIIVIGIAACAILGLIIAHIITSSMDKRKARRNEENDIAWRGSQVVHRSTRKGKIAVQEKKIHQIKRGTRDPKKKAEEEAASRNTLIGGTSDAQREEKSAEDVFGSLGISSKKAEEIDKAKEQIIINGYLQKSNTAPIRPVYSNTLEARQQQKKELDSDVVGKEAETPALVMDSSAPSEVKITGAPVQKVKPTTLKRPTASRVNLGDDENTDNSDEPDDTAYATALRPEIGSEVSNSVTDRPAEVQEEKPEILKSGEEAIIPAAEETVEGFVPSPEMNNSEE